MDRSCAVHGQDFVKTIVRCRSFLIPRFYQRVWGPQKFILKLHVIQIKLRRVQIKLHGVQNAQILATIPTRGPKQG